MKPLNYLVLAGLTLAGCEQAGPNYTPIGDGLKAIAIGLVVFGVVGALAELIQSSQKLPPSPRPRCRPRRPRGGKESEGR